jgi:hypothetical protein
MRAPCAFRGDSTVEADTLRRATAGISIIFMGADADPRAKDGKLRASLDVVPRKGEIVMLSYRDYEVVSVIHEPNSAEPLVVNLRQLGAFGHDP